MAACEQASFLPSELMLGEENEPPVMYSASLPSATESLKIGAFGLLFGDAKDRSAIGAPGELAERQIDLAGDAARGAANGRHDHQLPATGLVARLGFAR